jgi:uncharacterized protein
MSMIIGACRVDFHIAHAQSLKDKRRVVKSIKERLKNQYNVSIAEIGALDSWQRAELAFVCVSNDRARVDRLLATMVDKIRNDPMVSLIDYSTEII